MSKQQTVKVIRDELEKLNQEIDLSIIKGVSYKRKSLRHKFLTAQLSRLTPKRMWFEKSFSFVNAFIF